MVNIIKLNKRKKMLSRNVANLCYSPYRRMLSRDPDLPKFEMQQVEWMFWDQTKEKQTSFAFADTKCIYYFTAEL